MEPETQEQAYRRGYQQGAQTALDAASRFTIERLKHWVDIDLYEWRLKHDDIKITPPSP